MNEEIYWQQKNIINWVKFGDRNTRFFHAATKNRRAQNHIKSLVDDDGKEWFSDRDLGRVAETYFKKLFSLEDLGFQVEELENIPQAICQDHQNKLMEPILKEKVKKDVFQMNPSKSHGADGMTGHFYQQFWNLVGDKITGMVTDFFATRIMEPGLNRINICLILKKMKANRLMEFRSISLSNVIYKIMAKVLANKIKKIMHAVIS